MRFRWVTTISLVAMLTACGGGSESGGTSGGPAPTPTPVPTPAPTPTPSATVFSATAAGPFLAIVTMDTNGDGAYDEVLSSTSADGRFGQGVTVLAPNTVTGVVPAKPGYPITALGIDAVTGFVFGEMKAPAGATVISPLTTLVAAVGSEAKVRAALGLDGGSHALRPQTGLLTFNPALNLNSADPAIAHDAARLTSLNLQLLALATILKNTNGDRPEGNAPLTESSQYMAEIINATGTLNLTDSAAIQALIEKSRYNTPGSPSERHEALANLVAKYLAAVPAEISNTSDIRAWSYGFRFYVFPEFQLLASLWPNRAAARIAAIDSTMINREVDWFRSSPAPTIGPVMTSPQYRELTSDQVPPYTLDLVGCDGSDPFTQAPGCKTFSLLLGVVPTVSKASVDSIQASEPARLSVNLVNGGTQLRAVGAFTGITTVTFKQTFSSGGTADGIMFVRIRAPD